MALRCSWPSWSRRVDAASKARRRSLAGCRSWVRIGACLRWWRVRVRGLRRASMLVGWCQLHSGGCWRRRTWRCGGGRKMLQKNTLRYLAALLRHCLLHAKCSLGSEVPDGDEHDAGRNETYRPRVGESAGRRRGESNHRVGEESERRKKKQLWPDS